MEISIGDVAALAHMSEKLGTGPVGLVGRMGSLSETEQAQIPRWAWWTAGAVLALGGAVILAKMLASHNIGSKV